LNIPIPKVGAEVVEPDIIIAPVVGFDKCCYRLGFGGGFYDRTLCALPKKPRTFGVGYAMAQIPTIKPQWYDVPLDSVITEDGLITFNTTKSGQ
jgi:5,10-methenyltetrahydrofolate synthetase